MKSRELFEAFFYPLVKVNEVFRTTDEQGDLVVYEFNDCRVLTFGSVFEQSRMRLHQPQQLEHEYTAAMLLPLLVQNPRHVTLLGLGAGVLASYLFHSFEQLALTVVEWRESVIDIAHEFFQLPVDVRLDVLHDDACVYMHATPTKTDWILSDLFSASDMSTIQLQSGFYQDCSNALTAQGWLVLNFHGLPSVECPALRALCTIFPSVFLISLASGNRVVMACKAQTRWPLPGHAHTGTLPLSLIDALLRLQPRVQSLHV